MSRDWPRDAYGDPERPDLDSHPAGWFTNTTDPAGDLKRAQDAARADRLRDADDRRARWEEWND